MTMTMTMTTTARGVKWHDPSVAIRGSYTRDHFTNNVRSWNAHVVPYVIDAARRKKGGLRVLVVGAADEGLPVVFLLENTPIAGRTDVTVDVLVPKNAAGRRRLSENLEGLEGRVSVRHGDVETMLLAIASTERATPSSRYDLVFVAGDDKGSAIMLRLAVLSFLVTAPGGMIVFDNYTRSKENDAACPRHGIDAFVDSHAQLLKAVGPWGWQAVVVRRRRPLPVAGCRSEFYHEDLLLV